MTDLLIATGNAHKAGEIRDILRDLPVNWRTAAEWPDVPDPVEDGETFDANALIKARAWCEATGLWTLADDSGLVVDALDGRPGVFSSRYGKDDADRIARLLGELQDVEIGHRTARFVCVACLARPGAEPILERGAVEGRIAFAPNGEGGFGYDPVFIPTEGDGRHLAEFSAEEKNALSHRGRAMRALGARVRELLRG